MPKPDKKEPPGGTGGGDKGFTAKLISLFFNNSTFPAIISIKKSLHLPIPTEGSTAAGVTSPGGPGFLSLHPSPPLVGMSLFRDLHGMTRA